MCAKCDRRDAMLRDEKVAQESGRFSLVRELQIKREAFEQENGWNPDVNGFPVAGVQEEVLNVIRGAFGIQEPKKPTLEEIQVATNEFLVAIDQPIDAAWEVRNKMVRKGFAEAVADQVAMMMIARAVGGA